MPGFKLAVVALCLGRCASGLVLRNARDAAAAGAELAAWLADEAAGQRKIVGLSAFVVAGPGAGVITAEAGAATLARAYDLTSKRAVSSPAAAVTAASTFQMASVSKTVVWTALTQQLDTGAFELDDPVDASLSFAVRNPRHPAVAVTYRHLYTHTSGMKDDSCSTRPHVKTASVVAYVGVCVWHNGPGQSGGTFH